MNKYKYFGNAFLALRGVLGRLLVGSGGITVGMGKVFISSLETASVLIPLDTRIKLVIENE